MEEFLNSEKFHKMAKEYNERYNRISTLTTDDKHNLQDLFKNICKLNYLIKKGFSRNRRFSLCIEKIGDIEKKIKQVSDQQGIDINFDFSKDRQLKINNKCFIFIIFDVFFCIFKLYQGQKNEFLNEILNNFFDEITLFYKQI